LIRRKKKNKIRLGIAITCLALTYLFFSYGVPSLINLYLPSYVEENYQIKISYKNLSTTGWNKIKFNELIVKPINSIDSRFSENIEIPNLEIRYNLKGYLFSGEKLLDDIALDNLIIKSNNLYTYQLNSKILIQSDEKYENFSILINGKFQGKYEISKLKNLSWQIDLININEISFKDAWQIKGQIMDNVGGQVNVDAEWMGSIAKIDLKINRLDLFQYVKDAPLVFANQKLNFDFFMKGDIENLNRFKGQDKFYLGKELKGHLISQLFTEVKNEKKIVHDLRCDYNENILDFTYQLNLGEQNRVDSKIILDENNYLSGRVNGNINQAALLLREIFSIDYNVNVSGGLKFICKMEGLISQPEIDIKVSDHNLFYDNLPIQLRCEAIANGLNIKVPIFQVNSPSKTINSSFEIICSKNSVIAKIVKLETGQIKKEFKNSKPIIIEVSKSGISINEFFLYSNKSEIKSILQILPNGEGVGKIFLKNINVRDFFDYFNLKLPYQIEGVTTTEIKFNCSMLNPKLQIVGAIENIIINSVPGGDSVFDLQVDKKGVYINSFKLNNEKENSKFSVSGEIPLLINLKNGTFEEDIQRERSLSFVCKNTSTKLLKNVIPKVEDLEGKISGELSAFKIEDKRFFLGNLNLIGGKLAFKSNLAPITDIDGEFIFTREKIEIPKISGKMGEGTFFIKGGMDLIDLKVHSIDFTINGKKLKLINDDDLVVILSPSLTYKGNIDAPLLKGTLYADYGNYTENLTKLPDKIKTFKSPSTEFGFWPRTIIDLDVRCDHKVNNSIKQSSFYLQGSANLNFKGTIANAYMSGLVQIEKGIIPVYSKEFVVEGGNVVFEEHASPFVNLIANYRAKSIDVKMQVSQSLDDPIEPFYSSLPSYSEEDIQRFLWLNLLPGDEGEKIDVSNWIKLATDYSEILDNDTLKWLKKFSFETRTRNKSGEDALGLSVEYKFDEPEWFSVKAVQDDNGVFNFFLVASLDFMGSYVDPSIFTSEDFSNLDSKLITDFINDLAKIDGILLPSRRANEFDIQYLIKSLNHILNINDFHKYLTSDLIGPSIDEIGEYVRKHEKFKNLSENNEKLKKTRKENRAILEIAYKKYFNTIKRLDSDEIEKPLYKSQLKTSKLNRNQKENLRKLIKDEMVSYVATNDVSYLEYASGKIKRVCASWGYKDAVVAWEKNEKEFLNKEKTICAVKFNIETGDRYKFAGINFVGVTEDEKKEIIRSINFEPHKNSAPVYYSDNYIDFLKNQVLQYFLQKGFLEASVSIDKIENEKISSKEAFASFTIDRKKLFLVETFEIDGNKIFSKDDILQVIIPKMKAEKIIAGNLFEGGVFHDVLLSKIKKNISEFYKQRGYYNVDVNTRKKSDYEYKDLNEFEQIFSASKAKESVEKKIGLKPLSEILPGVNQLSTASDYYYYFNQLLYNPTLRWVFLQNFIKINTWKDSQINSLYIEVKKNRTEIEEQILFRKIASELFAMPIFKPFVSEATEDLSNIVKLPIICYIQEKEKFIFGKIAFKPRYNDDFKTNKKIIQKCITTKEGEVYNIEKIRESIRKLSLLGVFQEVEFFETIENNVIHIDFILRESKTLAVQLEGGYGEFERIQAGLRIFDHNVFGSTKSLGLRAKVSTKSLLIEPVYDTPSFWGFRNEWVGFYENSDKEDFTLERFGFETNLHRNFKKYVGLSFGYKFENTTAKNLIEELDQLDDGYVNFSGVQSSFSYIRIDNLLTPHIGTFFKVKGEYNSKLFGSTFEFIKSEIQITQHFPISERITFSLGARLGYMKSLEAGVDIPIQVKFFNGGGNTIRGYDHNSIGPQVDGKSVGGEVRGIFNTELRFPLSLNTTKQFGVVFFDAGFLEETYETVDDPTLYTSIGIGYRLLSPIGPIRLDLGVGLKNKREGDDETLDFEHDNFSIKNLYINGHKARLHLSFGFAF
jgi:outer membrane protein assembly factor BamA